MNLRNQILKDTRTTQEKILTTGSSLLTLRHMILKKEIDLDIVDNEVSIDSPDACFHNAFWLETRPEPNEPPVYSIWAHEELHGDTKRQLLIEFAYKSHVNALTNNCFIEESVEGYNKSEIEGFTVTDDGVHRSNFDIDLFKYEHFPSITCLTWAGIPAEERSELAKDYKDIEIALFEENLDTDGCDNPSYSKELYFVGLIDQAIYGLRKLLMENYAAFSSFNKEFHDKILVPWNKQRQGLKSLRITPEDELYEDEKHLEDHNSTIKKDEIDALRYANMAMQILTQANKDKKESRLPPSII